MTEPRTHRLLTHCPVCEAVQDGVTNVSNRNATNVPVPGDVTLCMQCASVLTFMDDMKLRQPSEAEMHDWPMPLLLMLRKARANLIAIKRKGKRIKGEP